MSLGSNIRNKRKSLKLSQEYVAEQIGVSRQAVSKWETNRSEPSTANLIKLADLFESDIKALVAPKKYKAEQKDEANQIEQSKKDIKMQISAVFGRILMLVGFLGYMGIDMSELGLMPDWFPKVWWGTFFLIGVVLTFVGSWDYFNRKFGSREIIWFDLLFSFSFLLYGILPFDQSINALIISLIGIVILTIKNTYFFIPVWRKPRSQNK